ncbi:hypothetical protein GF325_02955 [Candidatus Bathyarchaeota archaeon]|nr:hypothetical protein [Candidatus Bathyarchaeota archaeon]
MTPPAMNVDKRHFVGSRALLSTLLAMTRAGLATSIRSMRSNVCGRIPL